MIVTIDPRETHRVLDVLDIALEAGWSRIARYPVERPRQRHALWDAPAGSTLAILEATLTTAGVGYGRFVNLIGGSVAVWFTFDRLVGDGRCTFGLDGEPL